MWSNCDMLALRWMFLWIFSIFSISVYFSIFCMSWASIVRLFVWEVIWCTRNDKVLRQMCMEMVLIQVSRCFSFAGIHNTVVMVIQRLNFGIFFFFAILSSTWNGISFVTHFQKISIKICESLACVCRCDFFFFVIKKMSLGIRSIFGVFHPMKRVSENLLPRFFSFIINHFNQIATVKCFFFLGFTSISLTKCTPIHFSLSPFFFNFFL